MADGNAKKKGGWGGIIGLLILTVVLLGAWQFLEHYSNNSKYKLSGLYVLADDAPNGGLGSPGFNLYFDYDKSRSILENRWTVSMYTKSRISDAIGLSDMLAGSELRTYLIRWGKMETKFTFQGNELERSFQFRISEDGSTIALDQWVYKKVK